MVVGQQRLQSIHDWNRSKHSVGKYNINISAADSSEQEDSVRVMTGRSSELSS